MTNGIESPEIDIFSEVAELTDLPILIKPDINLIGGVRARRTMETDARTTFCGDVPVAGDRLITVYSEREQHVLIWTSDQGVAVMTATSDLSEIRPLSDFTIGIGKLPERYTSGDIFGEKDEVILFHIGRTEGAEHQAIKERTQVKNFRHISAGNPDDPDDFRFDQWSVGYVGADSSLRIFPQSGDSYLNYFLGNPNGNKNGQFSEIRRRLDTYEKYQEYRQRGGVIGWQFMGDAAMLPRVEMQKKYPRSRFYIGEPQEHLEYIVGKTGIELTEVQENLFFNLYWIPTEIPQVTYEYGPKFLVAKHPAREEFVYPATLGEIGILSQVFLFTDDKEREEQLARYCRELLVVMV